MPDFVKEKISKSNKGKPKSDIARKHMSEAKIGTVPWNKGIKGSTPGPRGLKKENFVMSEKQRKHLIELHESIKGKPKSEETKRKISEKLKGQRLSEETKKKMSESRKGRKMSPESISKRTQTCKDKNIYKKVRNIETGEVFDTISDAKKKYGVNNINKVLRGEMERCGGYHWEYYKEE